VLDHGRWLHRWKGLGGFSGTRSSKLIYSKWKRKSMERKFTLEYWIDDDWYVGRIKEVPGVFSQGGTLEELEENIADAYRMVISEESEYTPSGDIRRKEMTLKV
jgi:predicted RNase H-like HicB family nuclease